MAAWFEQRFGRPATEAELLADQGLQPSLVLLGKTGAGKSSLMAALTGNDRVAIGQGFRPCTPHLQSYLYPEERPWLRWLDTRGLGEPGYEPEALVAELAAWQQPGQRLIVMMRSNDPDQAVVLQTLALLRQQQSPLAAQPLWLVHSHHQFDAPNPQAQQQAQVQKAHQDALASCWPEHLLAQPLDLSPLAISHPSAAQAAAWQQWRQQLLAELPSLALLGWEQHQQQQALAAFQAVKPLVHRYARMASGSDAVPLLGWVGVPAVQMGLLSALAKHFDQPWGSADKRQFFTLLGGSAALHYGLRLGARQLGKLVPVYGQTVGTAFSMTLSYASTYALGRTGCRYFFARQQGLSLSAEQLRALYAQGLADTETDHKDRPHAD